VPWGRSARDLRDLSPAAVLALQRTAGNAAVARLVASGRTVDRAAIQRAVGFEFQTGWGVREKLPFGLHKKIPKSKVLHPYAGFQATADEATTKIGAELEWVVHPPIEESAGVGAVSTVMAAMKTAGDQLMQHEGRDSFTLDEATGSKKDDWVEVFPATEGGAAGMAANPQVTAGVGLAHLLTLYRELGDPSLAPQEDEETVKTLMASGAGEVSSAAQAGGRVEGSERLKGLVAQICRYLDMGKLVGGARTYARALPYAKASSLVLARTDFAQMFRMLPSAERTKYAGDPQGFMTMVLAAHGEGLNENEDVFARGIKGKAKKLKKGELLASGGEILTIPVTRREWLMGIPGELDQLSAKAMPKLSKMLESMGSRGAKTDKVGRGGGHRGVIVEMRQVKQLKLDAWKAFAEGAFEYIADLNRHRLEKGSKATQEAETD